MPTAYVTAPPEAADDVAETLVSERLAACVTVIPCRSIYRWEGSVQRDEEVILVAKTIDDAWDRLVDRIDDVHPYDVPCVERFDEVDALPAFADWRTDAVDAD